MYIFIACLYVLAGFVVGGSIMYLYYDHKLVMANDKITSLEMREDMRDSGLI